MKTALYKCLKALDVTTLVDDDKEELLRFFMVTKNGLIRDQIAFIFSDTHYEPAVPFIFEKILDKDLLHNNGSLLHALHGFNLMPYFPALVKVAVEHEYESRLYAYGLIRDMLPDIPAELKKEGLEWLMAFEAANEAILADREEGSVWHFLQSTVKLLK